MSYAALGFAKGFFDQRTKMAEAAQEKQDKLSEKMQALAIKGLEKRQDLWDKKDESIRNVNAMLKQGQVGTAFALYSSGMSGMSAADQAKALGMDERQWTGDEKTTRSFLEAAIARHNKTSRPEMTQEALERIQADRGVDQLEFESWLRQGFGLKDQKDKDAVLGTPYKGVKDGTADEDWKTYNKLFKTVPKEEKGKGWKDITVTRDGQEVRIPYKITDEGEFITREEGKYINSGSSLPVKEAPIGKLDNTDLGQVRSIIDNEIKYRNAGGDKDQDFSVMLQEGFGVGNTTGGLYGFMTEDIRTQVGKGVGVTEATNNTLKKIEMMQELGVITSKGRFGSDRWRIDYTKMGSMKNSGQLIKYLKEEVAEGRMTAQQATDTYNSMMRGN